MAQSSDEDGALPNTVVITRENSIQSRISTISSLVEEEAKADISVVTDKDHPISISSQTIINESEEGRSNYNRNNWKHFCACF